MSLYLDCNTKTTHFKHTPLNSTLKFSLTPNKVHDMNLLLTDNKYSVFLFLPISFNDIPLVGCSADT